MLTQRQRIAFLLPIALILIPFLIWPALFGFFASFTNYVPFQTPTLRFVGLNNYTSILTNADFRASIRNILIFTVVTVAADLLIGTAIAYALRKPFRGRSIVRFILLIPWL